MTPPVCAPTPHGTIREQRASSPYEPADPEPLAPSELAALRSRLDADSAVVLGWLAETAARWGATEDEQRSVLRLAVSASQR